jgi:leader peptidase (prepilin peptidase)/N-methyltransferase
MSGLGLARRADSAGRDRRGLSEAALVGAVAVLATATSLWVAPGTYGALGAALGILMLAIALSDARRFIIPDAMTAAALGLALVNAGLQDGTGVLAGIAAAASRGAVLAACFLALRAIYYLIRRRQGIGLGDVKLAAVAGTWLQWPTIPVAVEIATLTALAVYGVRHVAFGRPVRATQRLPFGLFFAPAIWLCWLLEATLF